MPQQNSHTWLNQSFYTQPLKVVLIGLIILLCTLPLQALKHSVAEKINQEQLAAEQFKQTWGKRQQLIGPLLVIPYTDHMTSVDTLTEGGGESKVLSKDVYNDFTAVILPALLEVRADLSEAPLNKHAIKTSAYKANLSFSGRFDYGYLLSESDADRSIHWSKAYLAFSITDTRALVKATAMQWNEEKIFLQPGSQLAQLSATGLHLPLEKLEAKNSVHEFKIDLMLQGSEQFLVAPVGETTTARISSSWEQPQFQASLMPNKQEQNKLGFNANWEVASLARHYPQHWLVEDKANYDLNSVYIGVDLTELPSNTDPLKELLDYALWGVLISLGILFSFELLNRQAVHLLQYALFAVASLCFFVFLINLSEEFPLKTAYLIASIISLFIIFIHSSLIFKSIFQGLLITILLGAWYYLLNLALNADKQLPVATVVYAGILGILGLIVAWSLVTDTDEPQRNLRSDNVPEPEENTHI